MMSISFPSKIHIALRSLLLCSCFFAYLQTHAQSVSLTTESSVLNPLQNELLIVHRCTDFALTGKGDNPEWKKTEWTLLTKLDKGGQPYESKFKILSSPTGIYLLFHGEDNKITTKDYKDFENIFNGDVFEVFFHPDPEVPVYFEYEVNQLDKELILAISNKKELGYTSWAPRHREGNNGIGIKKSVHVVGGEKQIDGTIQSWSTEIFFPFGSLGLMPNVPPKSGDIWNANFCRLDYDSGEMVKWSWAPTIEKSFHELEKFRSLKFQ